jgi:simple sugar transport system substrate-binding protein
MEEVPMRITGVGKRLRLPSIIVAALLVVGACGSSNSPAPSAAASGGSAAATGSQFCAGVKIVFFPGGTSGGGFETVVYNGAKAAQTAFGPDVTYQWSDWDPQKMITQFQQALATKPDAIAIMGHPGDDAFDPLIKQAEDQGILVTAMNTELPKAEAGYATAGFGYVGAVLHDAGAALANEAIKRGGLKSGDRAFVWGLKAQPGRGERTKGIVDALQAAGLTVDYLEIDDATNKDPANGTSVFTGYASAHPDVKAMFIDHGNLTSTLPTYLKAANIASGKVYTAGFDASAATVQGIKDGFVSLVIDQQQYLQGFLAVEQLCLTKKYGFSGLFVNTGGGFIDKSNVDVIAPLVQQQIR